MSNFDASAIKTIDQSTVENEGPRFPTVSFISGDPKQKKGGGVSYEGGFFIAADGAPADMTEYGWTKDSIMTASGKEIDGYWSREISVSVINHRRRWVVDGQGFPWNAYDEAAKTGNPRGHQQFLVLVKGAEALGPFSLTLKGHAGMSFQGARSYAATGALSCLNRTVVAAANAKTKPSKWPFRAFWLTVAAQKDAKKNPVFTEVGTGSNVSTVVLPVPVGLPEKASEVDLNQFYIGNDLLSVVNQLNTESADWVSLWETKSTEAGHRNGATDAKPEAVDGDAAEELGL